MAARCVAFAASFIPSMLSARTRGGARHNAVLACCLASSKMIGSVAAFSAAATPALTSLLSDPTLLGDGVVTGADTFDVVDPGASRGQFDDGSATVARVRRMGREDTRAAIDRARAALPGWRDGATAQHRSGVLSRWSALIKENSEDIAKIMTMESGKPIQESRGEVAYGTSFLDYFAAEAIRPNCAGGGYMCPSPFAAPDGSPRGRIMAVNEAVGV